ncbi:multi-sensor signal transduction multi-kinase [Stanieria sp. NIES-3757]|nr:multi-sensor signal transduction multi-kinase [Stanieria sp. NIES-3757]
MLIPVISLQTELFLKIQENQAKLKIYVQSAPMNFQNKYDLVEAECHRILGNKAEAIEYYDRAIASARENQILNEEALANELAAKFYLDWNKEKIAQAYMIDAYYCYLRWGAKAKLKALIQCYPQLLGSIQQPETLDYNNLSNQKTLSSSSNIHQTTSPALDFLTIFQASQALSSEIRLEKLILTLLQAIFANAGADQGVLLLVNENNLTIEAIAKLGEEPQVLLKLPVEKSSEIPLALVDTVKQTQETIVIADARQERWLSSEAYIIQKQPLSVLCTPILQQGQLLGILYLENNLTIGAFTSDRIEVVNLLCTQAAISLENARLYQQSQVYAQQLEQSLEQLQTSQARFAKLADHIPGVIYQLRITAEGSISVPYVSSGCSDLYEVAPEEIMIGRQNFLAMEYPEDRSEIQKLTQESAQNLTQFFHEWRIVTPSGMIKWVQGSSRPERQADGSTVWDGIVVDISDRKEAELALQESQHFVQQIVDSSPNILYIYDLQQQRNVYVNREIGMILGYTPEQIQAMGRNLFQNLMHPEDLKVLPAQMARLQAAQDGEIIETEYRMRHANGEWRWLYSRDSVFSRDSSGQVKQSIGTAQDIGDRKQAEKLLAEYNQTLEKEVAERTEQLSQTLAELQRTQDQLLETRKIAALGSLVAGVAHEVNTPVGTSITLASTLVDQTTTLITQAEQGKLKRSDLNNYLNLAQECSHIILTNLNRAGELIQTFKQIAVDQKPIESSLISVKAYLEEIIFSLSPNFRSLGHQVTISGDETISIKTDPTALAQVVTNLLMNSLKHAYKTDEVGHLHLNLLPQNDSIMIEFCDDGCGIPQKDLNRIFEPFFTTARHQGGTGLGLHIVHNLITQKLQGKIDVESEVGKGTVFRLTLPNLNS